MKAFYVGMTPWLAFIVADRSAGLGPSDAAVVGLVVALGMVAFELRHRRLRPLPFVATAELAILAVISAWTRSSATFWRFDRALAIGALAATFAVSSLVAPFTASYVRDAVAPRHWVDERFLQINRTLTRTWSVVLGLVAVSFVLGAALQSPLATTAFNWLVPMLIVTLVSSRPVLPTEGDAGRSAYSALESLMSDARDDERPRRGPTRLSW